MPGSPSSSPTSSPSERELLRAVAPLLDRMASQAVKSTFAALRIRNYRLFATGSLVSNTGTWMQRVAQDWLVLALTGSAGALGLTTGLQFLPILLFSPIAGVIADRFSKRSVMMVTQIAMSTTAALLGVLAITGVVQAWHVYVIAFAFGTAAAFDTPARQAFVNEMVGRDTLHQRRRPQLGVVQPRPDDRPGRRPAVIIALLGSGVGASGWVILAQQRDLPGRPRRPEAHAQRGAASGPAAAAGQGATPRRHRLRPFAAGHHARDGDPVLSPGRSGSTSR